MLGLRLRVCTVDELSNDPQSFPVDGLSVEVLAFWHEGKVVAGSSMCPHEDVSLEGASLCDNHIVCSAHGYAFDLRSGECQHEEKLNWKRYRCEIQDGDLYVRLF